MYFVVGSGPAGVAAAVALLKRGVKVTMLDAGKRIEPEIEHELVHIRTQPQQNWSARFVERMKRKTREAENSKRHIPTKLLYGSDYPYAGIAQHYAIDAQGVSCQMSLAQGGLSTVWGASILPFPAEDMDDWPFARDKLDAHYRAVLSFMPLAGAHDDLEGKLPLYASPQPHRLSMQAAQLLSRWHKKHAQLKKHGMAFGQSRLAVQSQPAAGKPGCVYCGLCLYGCPYELIYNSAYTLRDLVRHKNFTYIPDVVVQRVEERGKRVRISALTRGVAQTYEGDRVLLAAGVIPTTAILARSLGMHNETIAISDSRYFVLPALTTSAGDCTKEGLHTLAQLFLEIRDPKLSGHTIHTQLYTYNDLMDARLVRMLGPLYPAMPTKMLLRRLVVMLGFIHSNESARIDFSLSTSGKITLRARSDEGKKRIGRIARKLARTSRIHGLLPVLPMLEVGLPGKSSHYGCSFPMRSSPKRGESDVLGTPVGFTRVHAVDASVLTTIPGTTITLTVMANAHRIGSEVPL